MRDTLRISDVRFASASSALRATGLLGWATVALNGEMDLGYLAVRRTKDGRVVLSFPEHRDRLGRRYSIARPLDQVSRDAITAQIVDALRAREILK